MFAGFPMGLNQIGVSLFFIDFLPGIRERLRALWNASKRIDC
jgi:hypothetical protein